MHKLPSVIIFILSSLLMATALQAVELDWEHDYDKALQQAQKENKMVYLFIGADKCKYCEKFKNITLSDEKVITRMKKDFVLLYMSRDQHPVPDKFEKFGVPRHYFLSSTGKILNTEQGVWDPEGWAIILDEVVSEK